MHKNKKYALLFSVLLIGTLVFSFGAFGNGEKAGNKKAENNLLNKVMPANVVYAETLDEIQTEMNDLMSEIEVEMKNNPQLAMQGHPGSFIKSSDSYKNIINLGLKAVKPLYDKLYESRDAGLYEYILAMAVQDITGEEFVYNTDYGWKNSLEFRMAYEEKVNNVKFNIEKIISDEQLSDDQKAEKFKEQGLFAVSSLIKEYNNKDSKVSKETLEDSIKDITSNYDSNVSERSSNLSDDFESTISENKELFDSLVDLNGKAYK